MGLEYNMQLIMSGVLNCVQLVGVASSLWSMDRIGRRPLLLWGSLIMFVSHLIISILVGKYSHDWPSYRPEGWASVAMLLVYMLGFGASWVSCYSILRLAFANNIYTGPRAMGNAIRSVPVYPPC